MNSVSDQMCAFLHYSGQDIDLFLPNFREVYADKQHEDLAPFNVNSRIAVSAVVGEKGRAGEGRVLGRQAKLRHGPY
jgi:hypothetical protein